MGQGLFCDWSICVSSLWKSCHQQKELDQTGRHRDRHARLLGNLIWFIFAGVWLAIGHLLAALFCFVTIIGIPFGIQHLKLASIALASIGKTIVDKEVAEAAGYSGI